MPQKTPTETAQELGAESLRMMEKVSGQSKQTLINWHKNKPKLFELVAMGVAEKIKLTKFELKEREVIDIARTEFFDIQVSGNQMIVRSDGLMKVMPGAANKITIESD